MKLEDDILDDNNFPDEEAINDKGVKYAGFWIRVGASLLDFLVLLPVVLVQMYNGLYLKNIGLLVILSLASATYKPLMEYYYSATVGKMTVNIKVVDLSYQAIDLDTAIIRYIPWLLVNVVSLIVSVLVFQDPEFQYIEGLVELGLFQKEKGYNTYVQISSIVMYTSVLAMLFNKEKQGLHDQFAGTFCIYK